MRFHKSLLSIFGITLLISGTILNVLMFTFSGWPTYLYFILMAAGVVFILFDIPIQKSKKLSESKKLLIQFAIIVLPIATIYIKTKIIDPRAQVIIAPYNYVGPYVVVFGLSGQSKLPREGRDIIVRLPKNGIVLTSSEIDETPSLFETYLYNGQEKYGTKVFTEFGRSGQSKSENCKFPLNYQAGYFSKQNDTSWINYDMNAFVNSLYDSLCMTIFK